TPRARTGSGGVGRPARCPRHGPRLVRQSSQRSRHFPAGVVAVTGEGGERERLHTSVLVAPAAERRRLRRQRRKAAARLQAEQHAAEKAAARAKAEAERTERRATPSLPAAGDPGPAALRSPGRFRLPRHQDTSATLAGAYPFVAEGGLGSDGVFVGQDLY